MSEDCRHVTRRTVLQTSFAGGIVAIAGCLSNGDDDDDDEPSDDGPEVDDELENGTDDATDVVPEDDTDDTETPAETDDSDDDEPRDPSASHDFEVETVAEGFTHPWGLEFLPDGRLLVTERGGQLNLLDMAEQSVQSVDGTPDVYVAGQGGLLDVTVHPEFDDEPWVYLTYSIAGDGESTTALGRGLLEGTTFEQFEQLRVIEPFTNTGGHFGSRVVFGDDGMLYMTTGDRQLKQFDETHWSQDRSYELGSTLRLEPDGSIPDDNPFVDDDEAADSIYSYGHRNSQGMAVHPETGDIWQSEHGEEDGDEINIIEAGGNYGWPIAHTGCEYGTDDPVGDNPFERDDVVDPVYYWECGTGGFPPAGIAFYDGDAFPNWQGDLFVGNLAGQYLGRFFIEEPDGDVAVQEAETLLDDRGWRIRDVIVEPETGFLYVAIDDDPGPVVRLVPE